MDQVSPALQYGVDQVETCSWESSSPHAYQSSNDSTLTGPLELSTNRQETVAYSVITSKGNPPSRSRDSTPSPANLQIMQESGVVCKEEEQQQHSSSEYSCSMTLSDDASILDAADPNLQEVPSKKRYRGTRASASAFEDEDYQHIVDMTVPPSTSAEDSTGGRGIPQCMQFGTFLQPGKKDSCIMIALEGAELWDQFFQAGTEMIITKSGRRMFPGIVISVGGLDPELKYSIALEFNPVDNARYKYINTKWVNVGKAEAHCEELLSYTHPESPSTGRHWMSSKVSFKKVKVTNNKNHKKGLVVALNSMHKYKPRVVVSRFISKRVLDPIFTQDLLQCTFVGVTAYQNDQVTQLKIDHNPFAKAFRESGSDNEMYNYGMVTPWPSPLLSPYGTAASFSTEGGQALPLLSPSCIPTPAGPSPLPQFNSVFCNWESSPPYSPTMSAAYRSPFQNPALLSPTLMSADHRQVSRIMTQDSPPVSPHLYQPVGGYTPSHLAPSTSILAAQQYTSLVQQQLKTQPTEYATSAVASGHTLAFDASGTPVGYCHPTLKAAMLTQQQQQQQQSAFAMPKIEQASSPGNLQMDI